MYKTFSYEGMTIATRSKKAERTARRWKQVAAPLRRLLSRLTLPNSAVSLLLGISIAAIVAQPMYA